MFEFFLGCAIYFSKDLVNWSLIGNALTQRSQVEMRTIEPGTGSWASTLRYRPIDSRNGQGRFYLSNLVSVD
uniref:Beta-xylosidase C-terminal Concanavalin A-like domain-containing protein n=1 Tax=Fusarium oxysporum (strain Fo5176) TaxID=660025 RepID=A0A0D2YHI9_FUSOF